MSLLTGINGVVRALAASGSAQGEKLQTASFEYTTNKIQNFSTPFHPKIVIVGSNSVEQMYGKGIKNGYIFLDCEPAPAVVSVSSNNAGDVSLVGRSDTTNLITFLDTGFRLNIPYSADVSCQVFAIG